MLPEFDITHAAWQVPVNDLEHSAIAPLHLWTSDVATKANDGPHSVTEPANAWHETRIDTRINQRLYPVAYVIECVMPDPDVVQKLERRVIQVGG